MRWLCHNFVGLIFLVPWKCLKLSSAIFLDATERERVSPHVNRHAVVYFVTPGATFFWPKFLHKGARTCKHQYSKIKNSQAGGGGGNLKEEKHWRGTTG